jgi:hypothetical protein
MFWPYFFVKPRLGGIAGVIATIAFWVAINCVMVVNEADIIAFMEAHPAPDPFGLFVR